ncbi:MAG TPA: class I SAM-dependent methyltransferase [Candidatus Limnocylindrales bacterium]
MHANLRRYSMPSAGIYDRVTGLLFRGRYQDIARESAATAPADASVLDVGCGPAEVLVRVAKLSPTLRLTGVDLDAPMIDRARRKAARAGVSPTFVVADAAALPFEDASFDLVVSSFAVHHWPDPHAGLAEIMRVLKPGGRAIVWDIASPMAMAEAHATDAKGAGNAASDATPGAHVVVRRESSGPGWLVALRMLRQFRRMTPQRFEFAKP